MPGPEQRKKDQEAKRQAALKHLRATYGEREERKSGASKPKTPVNTNKDNTSTTAEYRALPPVLFTTGHIMKKDSRGTLQMYKEPSSSASRKRKAEDSVNADGSEEDDRPKQGHTSKKIKASNGYGPGPGALGHIKRDSRGTMQIYKDPSSSASRKRKAEDSVNADGSEEEDRPKQGHMSKKAKAINGCGSGTGALGHKSTNAPIKRRERFSEQDTENLNRNALRHKMLCNSTSQATQTRPTRGPPKVAEPDPMEGVMENSLARCKRKAECGLEKEATKRPKIGPTVLPSARKPGGFMQSIQLPGHVAAMPTNIKHVREVVRAPCASQPHKSCHKSASPKMPETNEESRRAKNEERVASSKKRSFEDDTEKRVSKKAKLSGPEGSAWKAPAAEEDPEEPPKGLSNHFRACFANAGLQGLFGVPELTAHFESFKGKTLEEVRNIIAGDATLSQKGKPTRDLQKKREQLRSAFARSKDNISIGAYFGELAKDLRAKPGGGSVSPFVFLQACGAVFKDKDSGLPLDGDSSQDTSQFINELLERLHEENGTADVEKPNLVQDLFNVQKAAKLECTKCGHLRDITEEPAGRYTLDVVLPLAEQATTLAQLLNDVRKSESLEDHRCPHCKSCDTTREDVYVEKMSKYLIVRASRVRHKISQNGGHVLDRRTNQPIIEKRDTKILFSGKKLDLSPLLMHAQDSKSHRYEVFGFVEHRGKGYNDGHYVAARKFQGHWYSINDQKVGLIPDLRDCDQGQLFFLRRVE